MSLLAQIRAFNESLVHPSARRDPLTAARHRAFIAPRVIGGLLALTALPVHLAVNGVPNPLEVFIYAWLATPVLIAFYLSRSGHYDRAQIMSSLALTVLITAIGSVTGGITSFAAVWLVVVPLEAALAASRRVVMVASGFAIGSAAVLYGGALAQLFVPAAPSVLLEVLGIVSAALYATGLALGSASLARASSRLPVERRPLPVARAQYRRCDHAPPAQRHGALSPRRRRILVRRSGGFAARTACSTACMSPTGRLSDRAGDAAAQASATRSNSASGATRRRASPLAGALHLGRHALPAARRADGVGVDGARGRRGDPRRDDARFEQAVEGAREPNAPTPPRAASSPP